MAGVFYVRSEEGFLGIPQQDAMRPEQAKAVIVPVGLELTTSYGPGTAKGPDAIIEASHQVELFDEEFWSEPFRDYGVATLVRQDYSGNISEALNEVATLQELILQRNQFPMILGGEHSVTAGAIRPFAKRFDDLVVVQFDAHADLRDSYEGESFSHAAAMRRVLDHENVQLVSIGIRNISAEEIPFLEGQRDRVDIYWAKDKLSWDLSKLVDVVRGRPVYITFDLDGFDSSLMPATGTPEPGGLFFQETLDILKLISQNANIVGADVVELAPFAGLHACDFLAAKLCYKILNYAFCTKRL